MKTVSDAYTTYRTMPALQKHQLRVAAVGKKLADSLECGVAVRDVVEACLFHDMGNIIKSDLEVFPEFREPEGLAHWQLVKNEFVERYGTNEHEATLAIARELKLKAPVVALIDGVGFSKLKGIRDSGSLEQKIVEYADQRVGPHGVLTLDERLQEARSRYRKRPESDMAQHDDAFNELVGAAREIERELFAVARISPEDITEESIQPVVEELREYIIHFE